MGINHNKPYLELPETCILFQPYIAPFYCLSCETFAYIVYDPDTRHCVVIDSVAGYDPVKGSLRFDVADSMARFILRNKLQVTWFLETQIHTSHVSAAHYLKSTFGGKIGASISVLQEAEKFNSLYGDVNLPVNYPEPFFDHLFENEETFRVGNMQAFCLTTPGHSCSGMSYIVGGSAFVGRTLLMPDVGTGPIELPSSNPEDLYESIKKLFLLRGDTRVFSGHDVSTDKRELEFESTITEQKENNVELTSPLCLQTFIRRKYDKTENLDEPTCYRQMLELNLLGGQGQYSENLINFDTRCFSPDISLLHP